MQMLLWLVGSPFRKLWCYGAWLKGFGFLSLLLLSAPIATFQQSAGLFLGGFCTLTPKLVNMSHASGDKQIIYYLNTQCP